MLDELRFRRLWQRLGGPGNAVMHFAELSAAYAEPQRHYHNAVHIADCLKQFDPARSDAERPDEVEAALWFHDVVYDPHAKDYEERSAAWAVEAFASSGISSEVGNRVAVMILATRHDREPETRDGELVLDVDLSILGREPEAFDVYERAIREEYSWVPLEQYRVERVAVLKGFLSRPTISRTPRFRDQFEVRARRNLERSIATLLG